MALERTLVIIKPEAVKERLIGEILARFERKGLRIARIRDGRVDRALARQHYAHHADKPFFEGLLDAITAGPVVFAIVEGPSAIAHVRNLVGATNPAEATPGSIRGDFARELPFNMVHASDSPETAEAEIRRFFGEGA